MVNGILKNPSIVVDKTTDINTYTIGNELTPVLVCDELTKNKHDLILHANRIATFEYDKNSFYPGYRAALPNNYVKNIVSAVAPIIKKVYRPHLEKISLRSAFYSFVAKQPTELSVPQRLPHIDSQYSYGFAILHYLNEGDFGGTGFFRHKNTNLERVHPEKSALYAAAWKKERQSNGDPKQQYFTKSNALFELIHSVEYRPNRLIVYPSNIFHSGLIRPATDIHQKSETGRLTANIFLDFV